MKILCLGTVCTINTVKTVSYIKRKKQSCINKMHKAIKNNDDKYISEESEK